jgi:ankyrin repeat protein
VHSVCELGANVNTANDEGATPVYAAAGEGHVEAIRALHEFGADVNTPDEEGCTPVYVAAECGHIEVVRALCTRR